MADAQDVNFSYGFELRGDRQVERGLESIIDRFTRTGSIAEASAEAVTKFGRIFEIGLPLAVGAIAIGKAAEGLYDVGEAALKTREKVEKLTSQPLDDLDTSQLQTTLDQIGDDITANAPEHGKKYGEAFWSAFYVGAQKTGYNLDSFLENTILPALGGVPEIGGRPSYDQATGQTKAESDTARNALSQIQSQNEKSLARLQRREQISEVEENAPENGLGKEQVASAKYQVANENYDESRDQNAKVLAEYKAYEKSIEDGHDLSQEEIKHGVELEKKLNDARKQLLEDTIAMHGAAKENTDAMKEASKPNKVIASHSRSIGGGGGVYGGFSPHLTGAGISAGGQSVSSQGVPVSGLTGQVGFGKDSNMMNDLKSAFQEHTDAIRSSIAKNSVGQTSTF